MNSDEIQELRRLLDENENVDDTIRVLRERGLSKVESIRALVETGRFDMSLAKSLVHASPAWDDVRERDDGFHADLDDHFAG